MTKPLVTPQQLDHLLPQTQCGLCGYGGCMPYAKAMIFEEASINLCPPGGVKTLKALGEALQQDPNPYLEEMQAKTKSPSVVRIVEPECIGCTKCIQVCPVDAIVGSAKQMHTVIASACTGCDLCIPACPVDCIEVIPLNHSEGSTVNNKAETWRERFEVREQRLTQEKKEKETPKLSNNQDIKQQYIQNALTRAKQKRSS